MLQDRDVEQVLEAGLVEAVQIRIFEDVGGFATSDIKVTLEDDQILRQCAGLIGAQDIHRPEVLNCIQAFDDDPLARHCHSAFGQIDRHDHRQHLRRETHRHRHREQQCLKPIAFGDAVDDEHQRRHYDDETDHQPGKPSDAFVKAGEDSLLGNCVRHLAEGSARASERDNAAADSADNGTTHEANVRKIERRLLGSDMSGGDLLDRHGLTGEGRLVHEKVLRRDQPEVGGDHVPGGQENDIAGHELPYRHVDRVKRRSPCLPTNGSVYQNHPLQLVGSIVGSMFLDEAQRDAQNHHDGDHECGPLVAEEVGHRRKREQKPVQRVDRAADELTEDRMTRPVSDLIRSNRTEPLRHLISREAARSAGKSMQRLVGGKPSNLNQSLPACGQPFNSSRRQLASTLRRK